MGFLVIEWIAAWFFGVLVVLLSFWPHFIASTVILSTIFAAWTSLPLQMA